MALFLIGLQFLLMLLPSLHKLTFSKMSYCFPLTVIPLCVVFVCALILCIVLYILFFHICLCEMRYHDKVNYSLFWNPKECRVWQRSAKELLDLF